MSLEPTQLTERSDDRDIELSMTVVRYSDSPDRCTVYPPGLSGVARMSTWISADRSLCVDVASMR